MCGVSVIIPIYGVEKYIERCARSLMEQTLADIEYIFVNDYTPDHSIDILNQVIEDYPHRKEQVKILSTPKNSGQTIARELGRKASSGEYLIFCDSDDWVEKDMYEKMYTKAKQGDYDIVKCRHFRSDFSGKEYVVKEQISDNQLDFIKGLLSRKIFGTLWSTLIRRSLFECDIVFPKDNIREDLTLLVQLAYYSKSIGLVNQALYHYCIQGGSTSFAPNNEKLASMHIKTCNNLLIISNFLEDKQISHLCSREIKMQKFNIKQVICPLAKDAHYKDIWDNCFPELRPWEIIFYNEPLRRKIKYLLTLIGIYPLKCCK